MPTAPFQLRSTLSRIIAYILLVIVAIAKGSAQDTNGNCSITWVSPAILGQEYCSANLTEAIDPVVFVIEGTGLQVTGLPPGVTAILSNDTLTIAGVISAWGEWETVVSVNEGCSEDYGFYVSQVVDPQYACTVVDDNVVISWQGLNTPFMIGGTILISVYVGGPSGDMIEFIPIFTPEENSWTINGLPQDIPLTFVVFCSGGYPTCSMETAELTCTIISSGTPEAASQPLSLSPVPVDDQLLVSWDRLVEHTRITDLVGHQVATFRPGTPSPRLDVSGLAPGAYLLHLTGSGTSVSKRFIKR